MVGKAHFAYLLRTHPWSRYWNRNLWVARMNSKLICEKSNIWGVLPVPITQIYKSMESKLIRHPTNDA